MLYVHVNPGYSTNTELFVAENEQEMLIKLKKRFNRNDSKAKDLAELEEELKKMGRGYHGAADLCFKLVTPN